MPSVSFSDIRIGARYTREQLAEIWNYAGYHGLARGVVTPQGGNAIILFVTEDKPSDRTQYEDRLTGDILHWEGPTDHFAEDRMINANRNGDEIHLFYRLQTRAAFTYLGQVDVVDVRRLTNRPSQFRLRIRSVPSGLR